MTPYTQYAFDLSANVKSMCILIDCCTYLVIELTTKADPALWEMSSFLVPRKYVMMMMMVMHRVKEELFWRRYFYRVDKLINGIKSKCKQTENNEIVVHGDEHVDVDEASLMQELEKELAEESEKE